VNFLSLANKPLAHHRPTAVVESSNLLPNKGIGHEQVMAELGITQEDIDRFQEPK
jgi:hypothetical protein